MLSEKALSEALFGNSRSISFSCASYFLMTERVHTMGTAFHFWDSNDIRPPGASVGCA